MDPPNPDQPDPNDSPAMPAATIVEFGAVRGARYEVVAVRAATQLPDRTRPVGPQLASGPVTRYQVKPSARTGPPVSATMSPRRSRAIAVPAASGRLRSVSEAARTVAKAPARRVGRAVGRLATFHRPRLPLASVARARNA